MDSKRAAKFHIHMYKKLCQGHVLTPEEHMFASLIRHYSESPSWTRQLIRSIVAELPFPHLLKNMFEGPSEEVRMSSWPIVLLASNVFEFQKFLLKSRYFWEKSCESLNLNQFQASSVKELLLLLGNILLAMKQEETQDIMNSGILQAVVAYQVTSNCSEESDVHKMCSDIISKHSNGKILRMTCYS